MRVLRGRLAHPVLRHLSRYPCYLHLQPSSHLSLLADDGRVIVQFDVVEEHLQEHIGHSDQVVVLLRLIEGVQRLLALVLVRLHYI